MATPAAVNPSGKFRLGRELRFVDGWRCRNRASRSWTKAESRRQAAEASSIHPPSPTESCATKGGFALVIFQRCTCCLLPHCNILNKSKIGPHNVSNI